MAVHDDARDPWLATQQDRFAGRDQGVTRQDQVRVPLCQAYGVQVRGLPRHPDMAGHGAVLLCHAGEIQHTAAPPFEMGRHAQQGTHGQHTCAAHTGDQNAVGLLQGQGGRHGQPGRRVQAGSAVVHRAARRCAAERDETGAKAFDTGKVLVAARLVDHPLASEFGFQGHHRHAIGCP